jgi:hypothetical protein
MQVEQTLPVVFSTVRMLFSLSLQVELMNPSRKQLSIGRVNLLPL